MSEKIKEEWRPVVGYDGLYEVSNFGSVKSLNYRRKKTVEKLKPADKNGYKTVLLSKNGISKTFFVHRLVAFSFIENPNNYPSINHKDENPSNNVVSNLEWCTVQYNNAYGGRAAKIAKKISKSVYQYDLNFNLVKKWNSAYETRKYGFSFVSVSMCCRCKYITHKGFIWSFSEITEKAKNEIKKRFIESKRSDYLRKKVYQYTKDKKLVKEWEYLSKCQDGGFDISCVSLCCNGYHKTHKGYIWSYNKL